MTQLSQKQYLSSPLCPPHPPHPRPRWRRRLRTGRICHVCPLNEQSLYTLHAELGGSHLAPRATSGFTRCWAPPPPPALCPALGTFHPDAAQTCGIPVPSQLGQCLPTAAVCLASPREPGLASPWPGRFAAHAALGGPETAKEPGGKNAILDRPCPPRASRWSLRADWATESQAESESKCLLARTLHSALCPGEDPARQGGLNSYFVRATKAPCVCPAGCQWACRVLSRP